MTLSLLPPNSTELERALEVLILRSFNERGRWIAGAKFNQADQDLRQKILPHLIEEYQLAPIERHFADAETLIKDGVLWMRKLGTPWAVKEALRWLGFPDAQVLEAGAVSDFYKVEIDSGRWLDLRELPEFRRMMALAMPARVRLQRVFHGYDARVLRASADGRWSDWFYLSDDSGVDVDGLRLSFARRHDWQAALGTPFFEFSTTRLHGLSAQNDDVLRWAFHFGDPFLRNNRVTHGRLHGILAQRHDGFLGSTRRIVSRSSFVLDEDVKLGELHCRFGGYVETAPQAFCLDNPDHRLSEFSTGFVRLPIDEVFERFHAHAAAYPAHTARRHFGVSRFWQAGARWNDAPCFSQDFVLDKPCERFLPGVVLASRGHGFAAVREMDGWRGCWGASPWHAAILSRHVTSTYKRKLQFMAAFSGGQIASAKTSQHRSLAQRFDALAWFGAWDARTALNSGTRRASLHMMTAALTGEALGFAAQRWHQSRALSTFDSTGATTQQRHMSRQILRQVDSWRGRWGASPWHRAVLSKHSQLSGGQI